MRVGIFVMDHVIKYMMVPGQI